MTLMWRMLRALGRGVLGLAIFFGLSVAWTGGLFLLKSWSPADPGNWPGMSPIIVGSGASGRTRVILYRKLEDEIKADPTLVPWPLVNSGTGQDGEAHTSWQAVGGKPWQFEARWDDRDYILESRYRLEGDRPVLVEQRSRDPGLGFIGVILAVITLLIWKSFRWWCRRKSAVANE